MSSDRGEDLSFWAEESLGNQQGLKERGVSGTICGKAKPLVVKKRFDFIIGLTKEDDPGRTSALSSGGPLKLGLCLGL